MKKTKKLLSLALALMMVFALSACGSQDTQPLDPPDKVSEVVNVGVLNGPTGMGAVKLMDEPESYNIEVYQAPTDIVPKLISGELDCAVLPSNMAGVLYNKTGGDTVCVAPMVFGMLKILANETTDQIVYEGDSSLSFLKGKTIVSSGQGGTPEYALQKVLSDAGLTIYEDVNVEWLASHADVNAKLISEPGTIAMVPEPFVAIACAKSKNVHVLSDIDELWQASTGELFPMGVVIANRSFVESRNDDLGAMLMDLKASVDYVNTASDEACQEIVDKGFLADVNIAKSAIPNCCLDLFIEDRTAEGAEIMKVFNKTMFDINPASIGGTLPGDDLYYSWDW